jgi:hypothetical protein
MTEHSVDYANEALFKNDMNGKLSTFIEDV